MTTVSDSHFTDPVAGSSEPERFWTTTNVAEATPDLLSPLCWDIWSDGLERAWLQSMFDFGLLSRHETAMHIDPNKRSTAAIYGRQVANVAVIRTVMGRLPGVSPDDVERDLLGSVRSGLPQEPGAGRRLPVIAVRLPWAMLRTTALVRSMHTRNRQWWRTDVLGNASHTPPLQRLRASSGRFADAMNLHSRIRFLVPAAEGAVASIAAAASADPEHTRKLLSGFGNVAETALADDMWRVSRNDLTIEAFLSEYGFHGPNEGNVYTKSWREQPERVHALASSYRGRVDVPRPRARERDAIRSRVEAESLVLQELPRHRRLALRFALRRAANLTRNLEMTKASYLRALDGARAAARDLGRQLVAQALIDEVDDAFFLTIGEHRDLANGRLCDVKELIAYRRLQRTHYASIELPVSFTGMPTGIASSVPARHDQPTAAANGVAGGGGQVQGRARVVLDPNDDVDLDSGDILVCRYTDPSWAPLFGTATALVIDIGSASSHGAVVARELGIPYVIGTGNGTAIIRDGDQILVDGATATVRVLAHDTPTPPR